MGQSLTRIIRDVLSIVDTELGHPLTPADPSKGTFSGIALWLSPSPSSPQYTYYKSLIDSLSQSYHTSSFEPHVTLLSGMPSHLELNSIVNSLEKTIDELGLSKFEIRLKGFQSNYIYFQYVFSPVVPGNESLLKLREEVLKGCRRDGLLPTCKKGVGEEKYFPHLSLVYGEDSSAHARKADVIFENLKRNEGDEERSVEVEEVLIVKCEGRPEEWKILGRVELK